MIEDPSRWAMMESIGRSLTPPPQKARLPLVSPASSFWLPNLYQFPPLPMCSPHPFLSPRLVRHGSPHRLTSAGSSTCESGLSFPHPSQSQVLCSPADGLALPFFTYPPSCFCVTASPTRRVFSLPSTPSGCASSFALQKSI